MAPIPRAGRQIASQIATVVAAALVLSARIAAAQLPYVESFDGPDGAAWPAAWVQGSAHVTTHDLQGGRARLNGDAGWVARMLLPGFAETDVEATMTFEFANVNLQGIGFYARQNGGTLREYLPHGQGYAMFLKGSWAWPEDLGIWREFDGVETQFLTGYSPIAGGLQNGVRYRLRFRVTQESPTLTRLQARVWRESDPEPATWNVEGVDGQLVLQGTPGGFAIDIYNHAGASPVFIDDLRIERYPPTTAAPSPVTPAPVALSAPRPEPTRDVASIELALSASAEVSLALFDVTGREVSRCEPGALAAGTHTLRVPLPLRLAPGVYRLVARTRDAVVVRRLTVVR